MFVASFDEFDSLLVCVCTQDPSRVILESNGTILIDQKLLMTIFFMHREEFEIATMMIMSIKYLRSSRFGVNEAIFIDEHGLGFVSIAKSNHFLLAMAMLSLLPSKNNTFAWMRRGRQLQVAACLV